MSLTRRSALAVALGALLAAGGCTVGDDTTDSGSGDGAEITFLTFETPNLTPQYWDAAIKRITDKHTDIRVKKLVAPSADRTGYAKQLLASGQFPDVMLAVSPAEIGAATNLYAWQPDELGDFLEPDGGAIDGKVYQLPANTQSIPNVYYRKSMFAAAGITAPPKTYAELLDASAKLKAKGVTPFVVGGGKEAFPSVLPLTATVGTEVYRQTKDWMNKRREGTVTFADPAFVKALSLVRDLSTQGYIDRKMISLDYAATEQAFLKGRGAMYPMGSWFAAAGDKSDIKDDIGVFAWPTADGAPLLPAYTGGGLEVNAKSKHLDAAKKFALAFQLDKDNLDNSVRSDALFPAIKGYSPPAGLGPVFTETYELWQQHVADKSIVKAFSWETGSDSLLPGMTAKVFSATQDVILGKATPEEAAKRLDTEWSKAA
jgi:ABC-type glycerol-3-phosphate transport system substrate-binding protein